MGLRIERPSLTQTMDRSDGVGGPLPLRLVEPFLVSQKGPRGSPALFLVWTAALGAQRACPTGILSRTGRELLQGARASLTFSNDAHRMAGTDPVAVAQGCRHPTGMCHPATPWGTADMLSLSRAGGEPRPAWDSRGWRLH